MVFTTDGTPLQGLTGGFEDARRVDFIIPVEDRKKGSLDIVIETSCNDLFGISGIGPPRSDRYFQLNSADLVVPNEEAWRLGWDFQTLRELVYELPGNSILQNKALAVANKIMNTFDVRDSDRTIKECRKIAEEIFGAGWEAKKDGVYKEGLAPGKRPQLWGVGDCHIDTAWLWPYSVTQQKAARSWSTQIDLMDRYPEHRFATSSAQQFKWVEQLYPKLFERIKAKVKSGQFELVGGSWVENDCNMPSGEALARQMIFGQRYFQSKFGVRSTVAWLPDSFGLSGGLPQIIRGAGMHNFFTQKLSWNLVNVFPHSTFNWVGIDGTQVLCHMTPVDTYNAQATVGDVRRGIWNHKNLESGDTALLPFGNGDGGGGPLNRMLESLRRIRAVANENHEIPVVTVGVTVEDFYQDIHETTNEGSDLPVWHGELYLEGHRGTYTSHGSIKKGNRHSEILLRDVEYLSTLASIYGKSFLYPKKRIDDCWEKVLLNQFHDVLPGSAIGMVYEDAEVLYAEVAKEGKVLINEAIGSLFSGSYSLQNAPSSGRLLAFNTICMPRKEVVPVSLEGSAKQSFRKEMVQVSQDGKSGFALMECSEYGFSAPKGLFEDVKAAKAFQISEDEFVLKNSNVEVKLSGGRIVSLFDVALGRELVPKGLTGGLVMFERDMPAFWDAWDVEVDHLETSKPLQFSNLRIAENGPVRASLAADVIYGQSTINVTISLDAVTATVASNSRSYVRFDAYVDWRERHKLLKFEIPVDIHSDTAYFECAFGHVSRPTNKNTTQEAAKFEVCGHKYGDLSEFGYGVAILSESKYGYSVAGKVFRLSLLRAATMPDAEQDQGRHAFSWAVLPHAGHFFQSDVVKAAYAFNSPLHLRVVSDQKALGFAPVPTPKPLFTVEEAPNVILDTIKRGDDDNFSNSANDKSIILRLYEAYGGHARGKLRIASHLKISKAVITNLLEEELEVAELIRREADDDTLISLDFRGFQVITVKLYLSSEKPTNDAAHSDNWIDVGGASI
ncbi:Glycoside hydrolase, 38 vacuolar alpha mannosidase [Tulasnella sp. 418]|nr:Glycoside hydrolase, 38 vacuolar alpha mannosidase [Tulasnella sp. 418]